MRSTVDLMHNGYIILICARICGLIRHVYQPRPELRTKYGQHMQTLVAAEVLLPLCIILKRRIVYEATQRRQHASKGNG